MQCPLCKETIDDDSRYCDQCDGQIIVCSLCGRSGKGKRCIFDGKEMVPAGAMNASASVSSVQTTQSPLQVQPVQPLPSNVSDKIKLTSQMHGIMIEAKDGDIIGRKNGAFSYIFSRFNFVSGTHCKIIKTADGWHIQDMGSTNGTFYNENQLTPNTLYPVFNNTTVRIADIDLLIIYDTVGGGTSRL